MVKCFALIGVEFFVVGGEKSLGEVGAVGACYVFAEGCVGHSKDFKCGVGAEVVRSGGSCSGRPTRSVGGDEMRW